MICTRSISPSRNFCDTDAAMARASSYVGLSLNPVKLASSGTSRKRK
jgi:hypothetical protein